jgi:hypothetical protein
MYTRAAATLITVESTGTYIKKLDTFSGAQGNFFQEK